MIDFEQALTALANARVRLGIAGGLAVTIRGSSYVTFDLDFCYARDGENLSRITQCLVITRQKRPATSCRYQFKLAT